MTYKDILEFIQQNPICTFATTEIAHFDQKSQDVDITNLCYFIVHLKPLYAHS
jgi:hypothetical protein